MFFFVFYFGSVIEEVVLCVYREVVIYGCCFGEYDWGY